MHSAHQKIIQQVRLQNGVHFTASAASEACVLDKLITLFGLDPNNTLRDTNRTDVPSLTLNLEWQTFKKFATQFFIGHVPASQSEGDEKAETDISSKVIETVTQLFNAKTDTHDIVTYHRQAINPEIGDTDGLVCIKKRYPLALVFSTVYLANINIIAWEKIILNAANLEAGNEIKISEEDEANIKLIYQHLNLNTPETITAATKEFWNKHSALLKDRGITLQTALNTEGNLTAGMLSKLLLLDKMGAYYPKEQNIFTQIINILSKQTAWTTDEISTLINNYLKIELMRFERLRELWWAIIDMVPESQGDKNQELICHFGRRHRLGNSGLRGAPNGEGGRIELITTAPSAILSWITDEATAYLMQQDQTKQEVLIREWVKEGTPQEIISHLAASMPEILRTKLLSHGVSLNDNTDIAGKKVKDYIPEYLAALDSLPTPINPFTEFLRKEEIVHQPQLTALFMLLQSQSINWFYKNKATIEKFNIIYKAAQNYRRYYYLLALDNNNQIMLKEISASIEQCANIITENVYRLLSENSSNLPAHKKTRELPTLFSKIEAFNEVVKKCAYDKESDLFARFFAANEHYNDQCNIIHQLLLRINYHNAFDVVSENKMISNLRSLIDDARANSATLEVNYELITRVLLYGYMHEQWDNNYKLVLSECLELLDHVRQDVQPEPEIRVAPPQVIILEKYRRNQQALIQSSFPPILVGRLADRLKKLNDTSVRIRSERGAFPFFYNCDPADDLDLHFIADSIKIEELIDMPLLKSMLTFNHSAANQHHELIRFSCFLNILIRHSPKALFLKIFKNHTSLPKSLLTKVITAVFEVAACYRQDIDILIALLNASLSINDKDLLIALLGNHHMILIQIMSDQQSFELGEKILEMYEASGYFAVSQENRHNLTLNYLFLLNCCKQGHYKLAEKLLTMYERYNKEWLFSQLSENVGNKKFGYCFLEIMCKKDQINLLRQLLTLCASAKQHDQSWFETYLIKDAMLIKLVSLSLKHGHIKQAELLLTSFKAIDSDLLTRTFQADAVTLYIELMSLSEICCEKGNDRLLKQLLDMYEAVGYYPDTNALYPLMNNIWYPLSNIFEKNCVNGNTTLVEEMLRLFTFINPDFKTAVIAHASETVNLKIAAIKSHNTEINGQQCQSTASTEIIQNNQSSLAFFKPSCLANNQQAQEALINERIQKLEAVLKILNNSKPKKHPLEQSAQSEEAVNSCDRKRQRKA